MKKTIILSVLSTLALIGCQSEDTKVTNVSNARADDITQTKRELAQQLSENYTAIEPMLRRDITAQQTMFLSPLSLSKTLLQNLANSSLKPTLKFVAGKALLNSQINC